MNKTLNDSAITALLTQIKNKFVRTTDAAAVTCVGVDSAPASGSNNLVSSAGIYTAMSDKQDKLIAGTNITIAADGRTISATGGGGGVEIETNITSGSTNTKAAGAKAVYDYHDATKQDTISDLATIRSGSAKGATALQSGSNISLLNNNSGYITNAYHDSTKQDTISDLATIRAGAASGSTALRSGSNISLLNNNAGYITNTYHDSTKQDTISDLATIRSGSAKGATAVQPATLSSYRTSAAQDTIDAGKESTSNKTTSLSSGSTDTQYPSAKCVYDVFVENEEIVADALNELNNKVDTKITNPASGSTGQVLTKTATGEAWQTPQSGGGSVTSVGMTVPTGLTVTGSPITSSGSLAVSLASGYTIPTTTTINGKENSSNKVTTISSSSTDTQYPSAKCMYTLIGNVTDLINNL